MSEEEKITPAARYYRLHRDEVLAKKKEEYLKKNAEVFVEKAKRRAEKDAEKEAEKELKKQEKERKIQEKINIAKATSRRPAL
jgi:hypothetical protein